MTAKLQKEIQKNYRDRNRQRLADNGGRVIKLEVYEGTDKTIKKLCKWGGFEDESGMLTILMKNIDKLDCDGLDELLEI